MVAFTSSQNLSQHYWPNVSDPESPFLAFIQHTNLVDRSNYGGDYVYYLGTYGNKEVRVGRWFDYLKKIFPKFEKKLIKEKFIFKFKTAQQIVTTDYKVPVYRVTKKLYQANFAQIYPEDRGMNFAVREGEKVAALVLGDLG